MRKSAQVLRFAFIPCFLMISLLRAGTAAAQADNPAPPEQPVRLIFIHHSTGENWLQDGYGDLGIALDANNYFVSDTNYGWGPGNIGDRTDIVDWPEWFGPDRSSRALSRLYAEDGQNSWWTRTLANPGGENEIIMFKSCFPNSELSGSPNDPPTPGEYDYTVGSAKYIYNLLLDYFLTRPDKMFVAITAPPVSSPEYAANARAFNNWLVSDWLSDYPGSNVFVFDFFDVLTGPDNHHRYRDGVVEHVTVPGMDTLYYPSDDDHPSPAGSRKATEEFVPLLNVFYHRWKAAVPYTAPPEEQPAEGQPSAEEPESSVSPAEVSLAPGEMIAAFDDGAAGWENHTDGLGSSLDCTAESQALRIDFRLVPDGYAGCGFSFESPQDWSQSEGLSFNMQAEDADIWFTLILTSGSGGQVQSFEAALLAPPGSDAGWQPVSLPWSALQVASWEEDSGQVFDPALVVGLEFSFGTGTEPLETIIRIDDLRLGTSPAPAVQSEPEQGSQEPAPAEEENPMEAEGEDGGGGLAGLCPLSLALPLAVVGLSLGKRWKGVQHAIR